MAATTTFNISVFPGDLKKIHKKNVWHLHNIPIQFSTPEKFREFVKNYQGPHSTLISYRVDGYVPLSLGDDVCLYKTWFRVSNKTFNADSENLTYEIG